MRSATAANLADSFERIARGLSLQQELLMEAERTPPELSRPMLDAVGLFEDLDIGYALIGGLAAMVYGRARFTIDVNFVARPDYEEVLTAHPAVMRKHRFDSASTWKLYHESGVEIDLWKDEHAVDIIARAVSTPLADRAVRIIEPHDLIAMKLRADRPQDDYDIAEVLKHTRIDDAVIRQRVTAQQFEAFLAIKKRIT